MLSSYFIIVQTLIRYGPHDFTLLKHLFLMSCALNSIRELVINDRKTIILDTILLATTQVIKSYNLIFFQVGVVANSEEQEQIHFLSFIVFLELSIWGYIRW